MIDSPRNSQILWLKYTFENITSSLRPYDISTLPPEPDTFFIPLHSLVHPISVPPVFEMDLEVIDAPPWTRLIILSRTIITAYPWRWNITDLRASPRKTIK
jgi:hypothetical protein